MEFDAHCKSECVSKREKQLTSGEIGKELRSATNGRTVPSSIGEQVLADVDRVSRRANHRQHHIQMILTETTLTATQTQRPGPRTVRSRVPRHLATIARKSPKHRYSVVSK